MAEENKIENDGQKKDVNIGMIQKSNSLSVTMLYFLTIVTFCLIFFFIYNRNPNAFVIEENTVVMLNKMVNAFTLLVIPFIFGGIASATKLAFNGMNIFEHNKVIGSSGFFAAFSWIGIKSELAISLLLPNLTETSKIEFSSAAPTDNEFYTMVFVSIIVGMFASNFYLFVNKKVEQITDTKDIK